MATHTSSESNANAPDRVLNLIDVATKLASDSDGPRQISNTRGRAEIIPHFTEWSHLSMEQKAQIFDLLIESYGKGLGNPQTDISQKTDTSFISNTELRAKSSELSEMLTEGVVSSTISSFQYIFSRM